MEIKKGIVESIDRALNRSDIFQRNDIEPDAWQKQLLESDSKRISVCCSRQAGKSLTACAICIQTAGTRPDSLIILAAPSERQARENLNRCYDLLRKAGYSAELSKKTVSELSFKNGSRIIAVSGLKSENIRGYPSVSLVVVDEAAYCVDELFAALSPMMAVNRNGRIILLSTPAGSRGAFYKIHKHNDDYLKITIPASQIDRISCEFLDSERKQLGEAIYRQEYMCDFTAADNSLLATEIIESTFVSMGTIDSIDTRQCITKDSYSISL